MRERVSFVHPPGGGIDPEELEIQDVGMLGPQIELARQDRLTVKWDELPKEVTELLRDYQEVHIRWTSPLQYETLDPLTSRQSPGFHLSYKPLRDGENDPARLCSFLQPFGPLKCNALDAFTSENFFFFFYQGLEDLHNFVTYAMQDICPDLDSICQARVRGLYMASTLDISFTTASNTLVFTAGWPLRTQSIAVPASGDRRIEVGILTKDVPAHLQPYELGVSGILTVLGEQKKPSPALFQFPSRHRQVESDFSSKFLTPTGLHPTLQLSLGSSQPPVEDAGCAPYAYLTLPKTIFADRYQLDDSLFLASKNLTVLRHTSLPVDLEAPAYTTESWGSNVLLELAPPETEEGQAWTAEIPLHLRYLEPSDTGNVQIEVPYPAVFWACSSGAPQLDSPFDRVHLGYDALFEPDIVFWHVTPRPESGNRVMNPITVPVLKEEGAGLIGLGTALVVSIGLAWVLWKIAQAATDSSTRGSRKSSRASEGKGSETKTQ